MRKVILGVLLVTGLFAETVSSINIASTVGELTPFIVIFGILSRIATMNFSGINKLLLFIALTVIPTIYVYMDVTNNIRVAFIVMGLLSILSVIVRIISRKNQESND